jgi:hypothetical protein
MRVANLLLCLTALLALGACQSDEAPEAEAPAPAASGLPDDALAAGGATLRLTVVERKAGSVLVDLGYYPGEEAALPRAAEVWLSHGPGLQYVSSEPLKATAASGKSLVVQPREGGKVRSIVYSTANLDTLQPGPVARYRFEVLSEGPLWLEVERRMPTFAPAEANQGILLPDRLQIQRSR